MSLLARQRRRRESRHAPLEDPISGVANLFDASIVFIVSMMIALFMAYDMTDLINPQASVTMTRQLADGGIEVITREGREIRIHRSSDRELSGQGELLGTAYRLADGRVVYVPGQP
ncbi:MAG: DUF2149 domain-containing protein [Steroidobacteraceae bacterium]|nr:DUF2149 domain-containing protein [Nevskiaceae bacterium]MCP5471203.1 DUF2149 domain-containing protein [Nevskiaceae bacterium]